MITIYKLKSHFQNLLRPLSNWLAKNTVTPNQVTVYALFSSFLMGLCIAIFHLDHWPFLILPIFLIFRMALNAIDGMLAREHHMQTALGIFLNELGDVLSDIFLYLPFSFIQGVSATLVFFVVIFAVISEMAGIIAVQVGSKRRYDGPMGKSDRALFFGIISLLLGLEVPSKIWLNVALVLTLFLLILTIINRIKLALESRK